MAACSRGRWLLAVAGATLTVLRDARSPALDVLAIEQLYAVMFRQHPQGRYCLAVGSSPCDARRDGVSHPHLLLALASERERAASLAGMAFEALPWRVVSLGPAPMTAADSDHVAVHVKAESGRPLPGVTVYFDRAPHSVCHGRTGADGIASCRLVDQHGDDGAEAHEDAQAPVVVTYPGDVGPDRVLLPTTFVLPAPGR